MSKEKSCIFGESENIVKGTKAPALIQKRVREVEARLPKNVNPTSHKQQYRNKGNLHSNKLIKGDLEKK